MVLSEGFDEWYGLTAEKAAAGWWSLGGGGGGLAAY